MHYQKLGWLFIFWLVLSCQNQNKSDQESARTAVKAVPDQENDQTEPTQPDLITDAPAMEGMVFIQGGDILIGSAQGMPNQQPVFETFVQSFYLDKHPVTVAEFREFVRATGHKTEAEKFGDSGVFDINNMQWALVKGATWQYPLGPDGEKAKDDHPVTHVSWNDAVAYAKWAGKRLPAEVEWEYAARNGKNNGHKYSWGDFVKGNGKYLANFWQGDQTAEQGKDGFVYTSPVGYFGETALGLTDMGGNVWEWCQDTYVPALANATGGNPEVKSIRGGSFLYDQAGESSISVSFRGSNSHETSLFNMGFRCAMNVKPVEY
ncbi:MAG: formylglycine-generating enzyme family protein [Candidatus Cyclobacteriaceae bacterium M3_2C_046]